VGSTGRQFVGFVYDDVCISISVSVIISCEYLYIVADVWLHGCVMVILCFLHNALCNFVSLIK
jgi:hypothetical protein